MARFASAPSPDPLHPIRSPLSSSPPNSLCSPPLADGRQAVKAQRILEEGLLPLLSPHDRDGGHQDIMKHEAIWRRRAESDSARPNNSGGCLRSGSGRMIVSRCGGRELAATPGFKLIWRTGLVPRSVLSRSAVNEPPN